MASAIACSGETDLATAPVSGAPSLAVPPTCALTNKVLVRIMGLPDGVQPRVKVGGYVSGYSARAIDATGTVPLPESKQWSVQADWVAKEDPLVRTVYRPDVSPTRSECDGTGASVDVVYVENPASGKLWLSGDPDVGFRSALLRESGAPLASVRTARALGGIAFDMDGDLWGVDDASDGPTIVRYPAAALRTSGDKPADLEAYVAGSGCMPFADSIALRGTATTGDAIDSVWVSQPCERRVIRIQPEDLPMATAGARHEPKYAVTGLTAPRGLAFDETGGLWIADGDGVVRIDPVTVTSADTKAETKFVVTPDAPSEYVAFDDGGNLWVVGGSTFTIARIDRQDLYDDGVLTPTVTIGLGVGVKPSGIAFDESGGLWIAGAPEPDAIARLSRAQLIVSSSNAAPTVPERIVRSADIGAAGFPAFYPAPVGVPLLADKLP